MSAGADHYAILGVPRNASMAEIKKAYRSLARSLHPDVAGEDPAKAERFKAVSAAYEVLGDPVERGRYDRRFQRRTPGRMAGGIRPWDSGSRGPDLNSGARQRDPANNMDLDDLFAQDFGMGGGRGRTRSTEVKKPTDADRRRARWQRPRETPPHQQAYGSAPQGSARPNEGSYGGGDQDPIQGRDIHQQVDVPRGVLERGGTVTLHYKRMRRTDDGRGLFEYDEIHDLKVPPGTRHGDTLRAHGWGHDGLRSQGDLVCDIRAVGPAPESSQGKGASAAGRSSFEQEVEITVSQALLGGRVEVPTPQGPVSLTIPPCTSGGSTFRLRGRGERLANGNTGDVLVRFRIRVPAVLDAESIALVERFRELNE